MGAKVSKFVNRIGDWVDILLEVGLPLADAIVGAIVVFNHYMPTAGLPAVERGKISHKVAKKVTKHLLKARSEIPPGDAGSYGDGARDLYLAITCIGDRSGEDIYESVPSITKSHHALQAEVMTAGSLISGMKDNDSAFVAKAIIAAVFSNTGEKLPVFLSASEEGLKKLVDETRKLCA